MTPIRFGVAAIALGIAFGFVGGTTPDKTGELSMVSARARSRWLFPCGGRVESWLYPSRSTVTGSSRAARWAGSHAATTPTATSTAAAPPNVTGSRGSR
jgi:hypothetical protein